jgi:signal transduction histidine kinase
MLYEFVDESREIILDAAERASAGVSRGELSALVDELVMVLTPGSVDRIEGCKVAAAAATYAAGYATLGEAVDALSTASDVVMTARELRALHAWVRQGLSGCVDALARERKDAATRERALRRVFETAGIVVVELDAELRLQWVFDPERLPPVAGAETGRPMPEWNDRSNVRELVAAARVAIERGVATRVEVSVTPIGLEPQRLLMALEPILDPDGATVGILGASTNITDLNKTQRALSDALEFRDQMTAILAHDLRNPLSSVRALSSLFLRKSVSPDEVQRLMGIVDRAARRMDELIGTLLDFSAARFGRIPIECGEANLSEVARAVVEEIRLAMPQRVVEFEAAGETRGAFDAARLAQVVSNLVSNALTHGSSTTPVHVAVVGSDLEVSLVVRNSGPPIPPELLPMIFDAFRGDASHAQRSHGLGLGLFIAKEVVVAHGGTLEVRSTMAEGTSFTVNLPRMRSL